MISYFSSITVLYIYHCNEIGNPIYVPWNEKYFDVCIWHYSPLIILLRMQGGLLYHVKIFQYRIHDLSLELNVKSNFYVSKYEIASISFTKNTFIYFSVLKVFIVKQSQTSAVKALILLITIEQSGAFSIATSHITNENLSRKKGIQKPF